MGNAAQEEHPSILNQDTFHDFMELCEKEDLIKIALSVNLKIPGFTPKKYKQVPLSILKHHLLRNLQNKIKVEKFLQDFVKGAEEAYQDLSAQEFFYQIQFDEKQSQAQAFAFFVLHYGEQYQKHKALIKRNIQEKRPFYSDLMDVTFTDKIQAYYQNTMTHLADNLEKILHHHPMKEAWNDFFEGRKKLKDRLETSLPRVSEGYYLKMFSQYRKEISRWKTKEKEALIGLALLDAIHLADTYRDREAIAIHQYEKDMRKIQSDHDKLQKKWEETKKDLERVKSAFSLAQEEKRKLNKSYQQVLSELNKKTNTIEKMSAELAQLHKAKSDWESEKANAKLWKLFKEELVFLSLVDDPLFEWVFNETQRVIVDRPEQIIDYVKTLPEPFHGAIFINTDGINSKTLFQLEACVQQRALIYKLVGGGATRIVRRISFYLEGAMHSEVETAP